MTPALFSGRVEPDPYLLNAMLAGAAVSVMMRLLPERGEPSVSIATPVVFLSLDPKSARLLFAATVGRRAIALAT
jgi:hypothetical protein